MAYTTDTGGGGQAPDLSHPPTVNGPMMGASSSPTFDDTLTMHVYTGRHVVGHHFDPREQKVMNQLGEEYVPAAVSQSKFNIATLMAQFDQFSRKEYLSWQNKLSQAGYLPSTGASPLDTRNAYQAMLVDVATRQMSIEQGGTGRRFLTPEKYLDELIRMGGGGKGTGVTKSKTTNITKNIYALDPAEARTIMTKTLQQYLGRDPTKDEVRDFVDAVNTDAKEDPTVKKTTTHYVRRPDGSLRKVNTTSSTLDTGYTSDDAMWDAIDEAKASPDYASYQAVSTYMPVVEDVLNSVV